jgi:hypothetical protein
MERCFHKHGQSTQMIKQRPPPLPSKADPPSVEPLRAIGILMELGDGEPIPTEELATLTEESGIALAELSPLIDAGFTASYIGVDEDDAIALTAQGWRWWRMRYADR